MSTGLALDPAVQNFVGMVAEIVARGGGEREVTDQIVPHLRELTVLGADIVPERMRRPREDTYAMYPLYVAPDASFCVASAVWGLGQVTPIHDHGIWGVIGILDGVEDEARYARPDTSGTAPTLLERRLLQPGDVEVCCTSDQDVHKVACASSTPTVALHVYGGDIGTLERHAFDPDTGASTVFVSRWASWS